MGAEGLELHLARTGIEDAGARRQAGQYLLKPGAPGRFVRLSNPGTHACPSS